MTIFSILTIYVTVLVVPVALMLGLFVRMVVAE